MKKTAYALTLTIVLFSTVFVSARSSSLGVLAVVCLGLLVLLQETQRGQEPMKKTALALALMLTILIMFGVQFVQLVEANGYPYWFYKHVNPFPKTVPPEITILSPKNHTAYIGSELNLRVNLTKPGTPYPSEHYGSYYLLDNNQIIFSPDVDIDHVDIVLHDLRNGTHKLFVNAGYAVLPGDTKVFFVESNSTVFFDINNTSNPTLAPSPTSTKEYGLTLSSPQRIAILSGAIAVTCTVLLAIYFKKRK